MQSIKIHWYTKTTKVPDRQIDLTKLQRGTIVSSKLKARDLIEKQQPDNTQNE